MALAPIQTYLKAWFNSKLDVSGDGSALTNLNASALASGTVPTARLGSGTANSSKFLRGDSTWQTFTTGTVTGTGTTGKIAKWTSSTAVGDSLVSESGSIVTISGTLTATFIKSSSGMQALYLEEPTSIGPFLALGTATITVTPRAGGMVPLTIGGSAGQTADLTRWTDNVGVLSRVLANGTFSGSGASLTNLDASALASGTVPTARLGSGTANSTKFLRGDSTWQTFTTGTVTSVGLTLPAEFSVGGSPVTGTGTLTVSWINAAPNSVLAGPLSGLGGSAPPTFRGLVTADIPTLDALKIATGVFGTARLGSGTANATKFLRGDSTWQTFTSGTVTSVALALPSIFTISGSPVTGTGTLTGALATQLTNLVFVSPNGSTGVPTFRSLAIADLPTAIPNANLANSSITVTGTSNQVTVSGSPVSLGGTVTLSTPQNIHSGASPTFDSLTLTNGSKQGGRSIIGSSSASYSAVGLEVRYGTTSDSDYCLILATATGTFPYKFGRDNSTTGHLVIEGSQAGTQAYRFKGGGLLLDADNTFDIGTNLLTFRPRTLYLGTSIFVGTNKVIGARGAALTAANAGTINSGDATTDTIIGNMRTRINELEARLGSATGHGLFT